MGETSIAQIFFWVFLLICIAVPVYFIRRGAATDREAAATAQAERNAALTKARQDYETSLGKLKTDPSNADLKQQTLALGRAYSAMSREQKAATIYDEMALMNDINAATAAANIAPARASVEDRLRQLDDLRARGLVTEVEYADRRRAILSEV
jgi:beta-lactamase regulating signal transducer with metallopeptidase domain